MQCRVHGCIENHQFHYCKTCKNKDSDHFTSACPSSNYLSHIYPSQFNLGINRGKCKVPGCTEDHQAHYCKTCNNKDSDHFTRNCPSNYLSHTYPSPSNLVRNNVSCRVHGCIENHQFHYCKTCKNKDSDHFTRNCPKKHKTPFYLNYRRSNNISGKCKVIGCKKPHSHHLCKYCNNPNSDHFTRKCPKKPKRKYSS